jgi:alkylated DNA repair dioxygenase AlkB
MEKRIESEMIINDPASGSLVEKNPQWLSREECNLFFQRLTDEILPSMDHDTGYNRFTQTEWKSARLVGSISTVSRMRYKYGTAKERWTLNLTFTDFPWLDELRIRLEQEVAGHPLNFVFINFYRPSTPEHPKDAIGWHSDAEDDMVSGASIISLSFGDTRHFAFRRRGETKILCQTPLADGDLITMRGNIQKHYEHCITERGAKRCLQGRFNLTFRQFLPQAPQDPVNKKLKTE